MSIFPVMNIEIQTVNGKEIALINAEGVVISNAQDALEIIANCNYQGAENIIVQEQHLDKTFFDLKTGLAGDILQKFSNYRSKLAIVGDFSQYESKSLRDFIYESNKAGRINFVATMQEATDKLLGR